ncbi:hypothetical protein DNTS_032611 [Danionella cerebrum]|uniref:Uncharacterized protein n=1 Tax=Danionella cerebrum TaxID=2873325 RepID=A0A553PYC9_9TELE|nr:hypothetical protein DNTS_032611 [Danionella translucida]
MPMPSLRTVTEKFLAKFQPENFFKLPWEKDLGGYPLPSLPHIFRRSETANLGKRHSSKYGSTYKQDMHLNVIERQQGYREPEKLRFSVIMH